MTADTDDETDGDGQWRFSLSDLEEEEESAESTDEETGDDETTEDDTDSGGNVAGSLQVDEELEAGDISAENALFVVVGVLLAIGFILGFVALFP